MRKSGAGSSFHFLFFAILFVLYGILIIQYLHNRSLWNDEAMLSLNIINRDFKGLLSPLDLYQAAPILFLQIEKSATILFGNTEYALRLFPLLCAMASLPLFYSFCNLMSGNKILSLCAMTLLGCTPGFVYYSSEVKQYSTDVFVLLLIYTVVFVYLPGIKKWKWLILSATGVVAIFLSNIAVVILFTIGIYFLLDLWKTKKIRSEYWLASAAWLLAFFINYVLFIKEHPHTDYMRKYWEISFMPVNIFSAGFRKFMSKSLFHLFHDLLPSLPGSYLFLLSAVLFILGLVIMFSQKRFLVLYLCATPIIIHLVLSAFKLYPFEQRLILYHAPLYLLSMSFGLIYIINKLIHNIQYKSIITCLSVLLLSFKTFTHYPLEHDEIKPAIKYINTNSQPGESIYVFRGSIAATKYYMSIGLARFDQLNIIWGAERLTGINDYMKDLNVMHGHVWLLISHIYPFNGNRDEEMQIIQLLKQKGTLIQHHNFNGAYVYLFDLQ